MWNHREFEFQAFPHDGTLTVEVSFCLLPGLEAGEYAVALTSPELADFESGRAIRPDATDSPIAIPADIPDDIRCPPPLPELPESIRSLFFLEPGGFFDDEAEVGVFLDADAPIQGFSFSIDFDETRIGSAWLDPNWHLDPAWLHADDAEFFYSQTDTHDNTPGGVGVDEGYAAAVVVFSLVDPGIVIPAGNTTKLFRLYVTPALRSPSAETELSFVDGGLSDGEPVENLVVAHRTTYRPDTLGATIRLWEVDDGDQPFLRGDCNDDARVDISDAVNVLEGLFFLFLRDPYCRNACDANDDGRNDISDAIRILNMLFLGGPTCRRRDQRVRSRRDDSRLSRLRALRVLPLAGC